MRPSPPQYLNSAVAPVLGYATTAVGSSGTSVAPSATIPINSTVVAVAMWHINGTSGRSLGLASPWTRIHVWEEGNFAGEVWVLPRSNAATASITFTISGSATDLNVKVYAFKNLASHSYVINAATESKTSAATTTLTPPTLPSISGAGATLSIATYQFASTGTISAPQDSYTLADAAAYTVRAWGCRHLYRGIGLGLSVASGVGSQGSTQNPAVTISTSKTAWVATVVTVALQRQAASTLPVAVHIVSVDTGTGAASLDLPFAPLGILMTGTFDANIGTATGSAIMTGGVWVSTPASGSEGGTDQMGGAMASLQDFGNDFDTPTSEVTSGAVYMLWAQDSAGTAQQQILLQEAATPAADKIPIYKYSSNIAVPFGLLCFAKRPGVAVTGGCWQDNSGALSMTLTHNFGAEPDVLLTFLVPTNTSPDTALSGLGFGWTLNNAEAAYARGAGGGLAIPTGGVIPTRPVYGGITSASGANLPSVGGISSVPSSWGPNSIVDAISGLFGKRVGWMALRGYDAEAGSTTTLPTSTANNGDATTITTSFRPDVILCMLYSERADDRSFSFGFAVTPDMQWSSGIGVVEGAAGLPCKSVHVQDHVLAQLLDPLLTTRFAVARLESITDTGAVLRWSVGYNPTGTTTGTLAWLALRCRSRSGFHMGGD